jgi:hypothetical protein
LNFSPLAMRREPGTRSWFGMVSPAVEAKAREGLSPGEIAALKAKAERLEGEVAELKALVERMRGELNIR